MVELYPESCILVELCIHGQKNLGLNARAHQFYAQTTRRANAAGVSCHVHYDLLRSMHDELSCPKCTNALAKIPKIGWIYSNAALR